MGKIESFTFMVSGGSATAGPPIGPTLSGKGLNIGQLVKDINQKTEGLKGMDVPVKINVDAAAKKYEIEVGLPPSSALLKKEAGIEKGSGQAGKKPAGALRIEHLIRVAKTKADSMLSTDLKKQVTEL